MEIIGFLVIPVLVVAIAYLLYRAAGFPHRAASSSQALPTSVDAIEQERHQLRQRLDELDRISQQELRSTDP